MGEAYLFFGDRRAAALPHYRSALEIGIPDAAMRATVLVQIGELSRLEGQSAVAVAAYRKFIGEFPRDIRVFEVRKRLAALGGTP
jgi:phage tail tape-measure protein